MVAPSGRWMWCSGCGRYHGPSRFSTSFHGAMTVKVAPPAARNFDGSEAELERFVAYLRIVEEEDQLMERRIDSRLDRGPDVT